MQREPGAAPAESEPTVLDVLDLEEIDRDLYRSTLVFADPFPLYGGQAYRAAKKRYDPDSRLLDLYAKAVQRR